MSFCLIRMVHNIFFIKLRSVFARVAVVINRFLVCNICMYVCMYVCKTLHNNHARPNNKS